jgi:hypothetical protein
MPEALAGVSINGLDGLQAVLVMRQRSKVSQSPNDSSIGR